MNEALIKLTLKQIDEWERLANRLSDEKGATHPDVVYCEIKVTELQDELVKLKS